MSSSLARLALVFAAAAAPLAAWLGCACTQRTDASSSAPAEPGPVEPAMRAPARADPLTQTSEAMPGVVPAPTAPPVWAGGAPTPAPAADSSAARPDAASATAEGAKPVKPGPATPPGGSMEPTVFDRVLVKTKEAMEPDTVKAIVARAAGAGVRTVRKSAANYILVVFEPSTPPRDKAAQSALVEKVLSLPEVSAAEGDKMMKALGR